MGTGSAGLAGIGWLGAADVDDGGALKMACCNLVEVLVLVPGAGALYVSGSSLLKMFDLDFAYWIF